MKRSKLIVTLLVIILGSQIAHAQKTMSEGMLFYNLTIRKAGADTSAASMVGTATITEYIKGSFSRTDIASALGIESTIYDAKEGNGVILKEYSGQKLMITLTKDNWSDRNKKYNGVSYLYDAAAAQKIDGYNCKHATAQLADGTTISVYYTTDINILDKQYNLLFSGLDGTPVRYEVKNSKFTYTYDLTKIDLAPVASAKFDYPRSGYRVMTYEESEQNK